PASLRDQRLLGAPRIEKLQKLLARCLFVPLAVYPDEIEQKIKSFGPLAIRRKANGKVETRLMIPGIVAEPLPQRAQITGAGALFCEQDRRLNTFDGRNLSLVRRHERKGLLGPLDVATFHIARRKARQGFGIRAILLQDGREDFCRTLKIALLQQFLAGFQNLSEPQLGIVSNEA